MKNENIDQNTDVLNHVSEEITMTLDDGSKVTYYVDVVGNVNETTPVFLYNHGAGDETIDFGYIDTAIENNNLNCDNAIVVHYVRRDNVFYSEGVEIVEDVLEKYDLSPSEVVFSGFSDGGQIAMKQCAEFCKLHEDVVNPKVVLCDAYHYNILKSGDMKTLADRGAIVYELYNEGYGPEILDFCKKYTSEGLNVFKIPDYACKSVVVSDGPRQHERCCYNLFNLGTFGYFVGQREFVDKTFFDGNKQYDYYKLPFKVDPVTGEWVEFDIRGMTEQEVYRLLGINVFLDLTYGEKSDKLMTLKNISISDMTRNLYYVRSDYKLLELRLNNIIAKLRNSVVAQVTPEYMDYFLGSSTVPLEIPSVVQEYFSMSANLMLSLEHDLNQFAKVGLSLNKIDEEVKEIADNL